jgi:ATP-binding cassette subfamily C protein CydC
MRMFLRLIQFLAPYRWRVAVAVLLGVLTVVSNVGLLATAAYVISAAAIVPFISLLAVPIYAVRLFSFSRAAARYGERLLSHDATFRLLAGLRTWFYGRLLPLAPARLGDHRSGDLLSRLVRDVEELENVYLRVFSPAVVALLASGLAFAVLYLFSPLLAVVALAFLAAAGAGVPILVRTLARGFGRREMELRGELNARLVDGVQGVQDLLAFGREADSGAEIATLNRKLGRVQRRMASITGLQDSLNDLLAGLAVVLALVVAVPLVAAGEVGGVFLAFLALVVLGSFEAVRPLGAAFGFLGRSLSAGERVFGLADSKPEVTDPDEPAPPPEDHTLEFDRVSFRYAAGDPAALSDVSFVLEPGSRVAVVGPSGSGKSTLANLALRFWDPVSGQVRFGGRDVRGYAQEDLRARIGVVSQSTHVFGESLRENLLLARPNAGEEDLLRALEVAQLRGLVESLPDGLDTHLGEQGLRLSGGERQRLAVARALLKDAPVLILDEPTANLDPETERELLAAVRALMHGRTTLLITHRLVALEGVDEVLVLAGGRVVERGPHAELAEAGGLYSRMLGIQDRMLEG